MSCDQPVTLAKDFDVKDFKTALHDVQNRLAQGLKPPPTMNLSFASPDAFR